MIIKKWRLLEHLLRIIERTKTWTLSSPSYPQQQPLSSQMTAKLWTISSVECAKLPNKTVVLAISCKNKSSISLWKSNRSLHRVGKIQTLWKESSSKAATSMILSKRKRSRRRVSRHKTITERIMTEARREERKILMMVGNLMTRCKREAQMTLLCYHRGRRR